jgi:ZIP family zinc transporter
MLVYTAGSGVCILVGGLLARIERIRPLWLETEFRHSVIAFGGGVLVAAVALVLVPEGTQFVRSAPAAAGLVLAGGLFFLCAERLLALRRRESPQFIAMLLDYVPESIALGGMFALGAPGAILLAILIGLQNLPEGFNAFRELKALPGSNARRSLLLMAALIPLGPAAGTVGWAIGPGHPVVLGSVMLFAAGGILYLLFQDIAPQSRLDRHWGPTLGAVVGFCLGMLGSMLAT